MAPTVILIRHAEGQFATGILISNAEDYHIPDPPLTELGEKQCLEMRDHMKEHLPLLQEVGLIVSSPLRRTLQTTQLGLSPLLEKGTKVVLDPLWQETSNLPCDTGTDVSIARTEYPMFDFDGIDPEYPSKTGKYAYTKDAIVGRGQEVLKWLKDRPEKVIAVVTHSGFLRVAVAHARYANADYRVYDFVGDTTELKAWEGQDAGAMGRSIVGYFPTLDSDFPA